MRHEWPVTKRLAPFTSPWYDRLMAKDNTGYIAITKEIDELRQRILDEQAAFDKMEQLYLIADARMFWMEENGDWQDNDCFAIAMEEPWYHEDLRTAVDTARGMFDDNRTDGGG